MMCLAVAQPDPAQFLGENRRIETPKERFERRCLEDWPVPEDILAHDRVHQGRSFRTLLRRDVWDGKMHCSQLKKEDRGNGRLCQHYSRKFVFAPSGASRLVAPEVYREGYLSIQLMRCRQRERPGGRRHEGQQRFHGRVSIGNEVKSCERIDGSGERRGHRVAGLRGVFKPSVRPVA
jgi:hypothetical protein